MESKDMLHPTHLESDTGWLAGCGRGMSENNANTLDGSLQTDTIGAALSLNNELHFLWAFSS